MKPAIVYPHLSKADLRIDSDFHQDLKRLQPLKTLGSIFLNWFIILLLVVTATLADSAAITLVCIFAIATRQHALLIIMHDAAHGLFLRDLRWNDRWTHWLITYPFLFAIHGFRYEHLLHHKHMNSDKDPNWRWKQGSNEWSFPKSRISVLSMCGRSLISPEPLVARMLLVFRSIRQFPKYLRHSPRDAISDFFYHTVLWGGLFYLGLWKEILLFWFLPMFTFLQLIMKIRVIAEHFGLSYKNDLTHTRNYPGPWLERWILAPENVVYHLDHHLFPNVPFYNLPRLHKVLRQNDDYINHAHINDSLLGILGRKSVWSDLVGQRSSVAKQAAIKGSDPLG